LILAWVLSLLILCSSLIVHLERLTALRVIEVNTLEGAQQKFIAAENTVLDCEQNLSMLSALTENNCFIQPISKNIWLILSKTKPTIQVHVLLDERSGTKKRLNWRQSFDE
jgi:transposase